MTAPRRPVAVKQDVVQLLSALIESGIADDQNFPTLNRNSVHGWEVSFKGAEYVSIAMGDIDYGEIHQELTQKRSYNAKLIDGGLLQMLYLFEGDSLIKHRLAYYPSPNLRSFREDPEAYLRDELFVDIVSRRIVPFPLRFDFDRATARDVDHPHCHLTLGEVKECRIPVTAALTPRWFVEFVLRNFYQTDKRDFVGGLPGHRLSFPSSITDNESQLIHVRIPPGRSGVYRSN